MGDTPTPEATEEEAVAAKIHDLLTESDGETTQLGFEEEVIEQVMLQFYNELSSPLLLHGGNNGSCGASVSDSSSSVMAGIKTETTVNQELDLDDEWLTRVLTSENTQLIIQTKDCLSIPM